MGIYKYLVMVYECQFQRTGKPFHGMSEEGVLILQKSGFKPGEIVRKETDWNLYKRHAWKCTRRVAHLIPGVELRGFTDHHIDHIISIWDGFKKCIPAEKVGGLDNLRMLPYKENLKKGIKSNYK